MPLELILVALLVVAVVVAVLPAGRRLIATVIDIVDASVAMYAVRSTLGLDTTTGRQRRIAERNAREQAEILRRIGGSADAAAPALPTPATAAAVPAATLPTASTAAPATASATRGGPLGTGSVRERHLRDAAIATVGLAIVLVTVSLVFSQPSGGVLGVTSPPSPADPTSFPAGVAGPSASPIASDAGPASSAAAPAAPPASAAAPGPATLIEGPTVRLAGATAGGSSVRLALAWTLASASPEPVAYRLERRVADGPFETLARLDGNARSAPASAPVGAATTFRLTPLGEPGTAGRPVTWEPISPTLRQETSAAVSLLGAWRSAAGPSLSGGRVVYTSTRGARATFRWTGTDVGWIATKTPMSGRAQVRLDGAVVATVDLGAPDVRYRQLVFRRALPAGRHTLEVRALGGGRIDVDGFVALR